MNTTYTLGNIIQMVDFLCNTDETSYPIEQKVMNANNWLRTVNTWIWSAVGDWIYDDKNYETLPEATRNLVANKRDYALPENYFNIIRVEVKDNSGNWYLLSPITKEKMKTAEEEFCKAPGLPRFYELTSNSIKLYPVSNENRDSSLKLYLGRDVLPFTPNDITKPLGFNVSFHPVIAYGVSFDYVVSVGQVDKIKIFKEIINDYELRIKNYYAIRNQDMRPRFIPRVENYM